MVSYQIKRTSGGFYLEKKTSKKPIEKMEEEKPIVHTDVSSIQQKLQNLTVGKGILSRKKYISF